VHHGRVVKRTGDGAIVEFRVGHVLTKFGFFGLT
jgi:hypothetical protein